MEGILSGEFASPLSIHTSGGVSKALPGFIQALEPYVPWDKIQCLGWCASLQLEGRSAFRAAIDTVLQMENSGRQIVAVGETSYHGPTSAYLGSRCPLWKKSQQIAYSVHVVGEYMVE